MERAVPATCFLAPIEVDGVEVGHLDVGDLGHLGIGDGADIGPAGGRGTLVDAGRLAQQDRRSGDVLSTKVNDRSS